ncbi:alpha/beta fold hydrolase [Kutzneria albida]|uniref:Putative hydrolase or acyltransferase of alpha/beta superfamily n=1 Tax=Kutzneria albida DSM 43870 TaxID=1449976 RepID=W5VYQ8_9PSEU|nr:alpha/beta hydrolase [Kutzneria albida]AHH93687.1 putative hydrolase or acyltransferase of alpha/beta superfamily [Kutzneria albida DSM 43870]
MRLPGAWRHRDVSANGIRLHLAESGTGPLVLLLHGFPEFWWTWRRQLTALAESGYRAVAVDLRGCGDSDKPPRGYDGWTLAGDVAGLVKALGARRAHLVGHGWGGLVAWTAAALHPRLVASVSTLAAPHPLELRRRPPAPRHLLAAQLPIWPERWLTADGAAAVQRLLLAWSAVPPAAEVLARTRQAMSVPGVAHCSLEYLRWAFRSRLRGDGRQFAQAMRRRLTVPVLTVAGRLDPCVRVAAVQGSARWVDGPFTHHCLDGVGHFPHREAPEQVTELLLAQLLRAGPG